MMRASYGHGTHNDFILLLDENDEINLSDEFIERVCNRQSGIGADGLIRIVRQNNNDKPEWFMDYRNQDGSIAQMCGNGIRVMARYLVENNLQPAGIFSINTRAGKKFLAVPDSGDISVNMGPVRLIDQGFSVISNGITFDNGIEIDVGNPHAVVQVEKLSVIDDLRTAPKIEPHFQFPEGVNVEFMEIVSDEEINMRVYERGVGETQSCGTGTCAVALAATVSRGEKLPRTWFINPPGGRLKVEIDRDSNAILTGPAVILEEIDLEKYL
jgi:diaminopimelate epimerase